MGVGVRVPLLKRELLPALENMTPLVRVAAGEAVTVELTEGVGEGVTVAVGVLVDKLEGVVDTVAVPDVLPTPTP